MQDIKDHTRVNDIFLGPLERPALHWLAAHLPAWATPDLMTFIGVMGAVISAIGYGLSNFHPAFVWLASLGLVINWFGDSLDGTLARYRHIERPKYGFFIDHITDALNEIIMILGIGLSPYVKFSVSSLFCIMYIAMSVLVYVRMSVMGEFKISYGKLGPTEARVLAILLNMGMFFGGKYLIQFPMGSATASFSPYDLFVVFLTLLIVYFFANTSIRQAIALRERGE
jgi:archaetidylinositol phosphate synthase